MKLILSFLNELGLLYLFSILLVLASISFHFNRDSYLLRFWKNPIIDLRLVLASISFHYVRVRYISFVFARLKRPPIGGYNRESRPYFPSFTPLYYPIHSIHAGGANVTIKGHAPCYRSVFRRYVAAKNTSKIQRRFLLAL